MKLRALAASAAVALVLCEVLPSPGHAATSSSTSSPSAGTVGYQWLCPPAAPGHVRCAALQGIRSGSRPSSLTRPDAIERNAPAGYGPADLRSAYNLTSTGGTGQTVAVIVSGSDASEYLDLTNYRSTFGLSPCTETSGCLKIVSQTGSTTALPPTDLDWGAQATIQIEVISAICPNCHLLVVDANGADIDNLGVAGNEAVALGARFIADGWFGPEDPADATYDAEYFNHPGVAIAVAGGDMGYGATYPASSRYVTAVGGTSLARSSSLRGWAELAWSLGSAGCSAYDTKPAWQTDTGCTRRTMNDVSADADPVTPVAVYDEFDGSGWVTSGSTVVAATIVAAIYALAGTPPNTSYPAQFPYQHRAALWDITSGSDGYCGTGTTAYLCTARTGYDGPTGLGTPDGTTAFAAGG